MINTDKLIQIHEKDNTAVAITDIKQNETLKIGDYTLTASQNIDAGHKVALKDISERDFVIKYGYPIGRAVTPIKAGEYIHTHNLKTNLKGLLKYSYTPMLNTSRETFHAEFMGYIRSNGEAGVRNEIWIINTVGCVNRTSEKLAQKANIKYAGLTDGIFSFSHPYGCSQLGEDHKMTQKILAALVSHPNAASVLVIGLGCENNNIPEFKKVIGKYDNNRVKFLNLQEVCNEIE
ncbi:MAG: altronate dehydratase, partial [Clostridiaceae bacterium]|nr:altronate dehydratase [Clostridiaceae bacterium]